MYAVKEIFYTLQGEGLNAGRAAVFCRFAGCNLWSGRERDRPTAQCRFCDTDFVGTDGTLGGRYEADALADTLAASWTGDGGARFVAPEIAQEQLAAAQASGDTQALALAERAVRTSRYYQASRDFARIVATYSLRQPQEEKLFICTGGGPGVMEAANRGAADVDVPSVGLNIALPHEQSANPYVTPELTFKFHYFALRKMHFLMRARALVAFPGGFGTLDELFEVLTLVQTRKARPVPIVLFGRDYWSRLLNLDMLVDEGAIAPEDLALYEVVDTPEEAWEVIRAFYRL